MTPLIKKFSAIVDSIPELSNSSHDLSQKNDETTLESPKKGYSKKFNMNFELPQVAVAKDTLEPK